MCNNRLKAASCENVATISKKQKKQKMKNVLFALAVVCTGVAATAMTKSNVAPGDRYVQTSPGVYTLLTGPYQPSLYCNEQENPCSFVVPAGDNTVYGNQISIQTATTKNFIPADEGLYIQP
ncbi:hypothetical protein MKQ68_19135 [Chitinophaga horti]|uniref:Uncharacterized protein n=1 Tax=Chitinophaga horti TaxID=2920382 RepID=A0ABY6IXT6_9BACT|nr:hypothetical protein [Chitinophaga horti]UYQ92205.1 hypothetical protein MKQ68_19135 [Chitinophaga horti]